MGRKQDEVSILVVESIEYLEEIGHPITVTAVKEVVLDEIGTGPNLRWGPVDVQQAVKNYLTSRIRQVLHRLSYRTVDSVTYERTLSAERTKRDIREGLRLMRQVVRYDMNVIRFHEGILALMDAKGVRLQSELDPEDIEALEERIFV